MSDICGATLDPDTLVACWRPAGHEGDHAMWPTTSDLCGVTVRAATGPAFVPRKGAHSCSACGGLRWLDLSVFASGHPNELHEFTCGDCGHECVAERDSLLLEGPPVARVADPRDDELRAIDEALGLPRKRSALAMKLSGGEDHAPRAPGDRVAEIRERQLLCSQHTAALAHRRAQVARVEAALVALDQAPLPDCSMASMLARRRDRDAFTATIRAALAPPEGT